MLLLVLLAISIACVNSVFTMQWSLTNDLLRAGGSIGTAIAIMQIGGQVFGLAAPIATGYILAATGSFTSAFLLAGGLLVLGAVFVLTMTNRRFVRKGCRIKVKARGFAPGPHQRRSL